MKVAPATEGASSDESEDSSGEVDVYRKKYQLIIERCEVIQQDNERLVNRIQHVCKLLRRWRHERKFLTDRLDKHGDHWRNVPLPLDLEGPSQRHTEKTPPKNSRALKGGAVEKGQKKGKRRGGKVDKNAPKRPPNPYFQFCQEQRTTAIEEMASIGQVDPSKVEVTKHLAHKWNKLNTSDKKVYYDMYEKSKERYNADMQLYVAKNKSAEANPQ